MPFFESLLTTTRSDTRPDEYVVFLEVCAIFLRKARDDGTRADPVITGDRGDIAFCRTLNVHVDKVRSYATETYLNGSAHPVDCRSSLDVFSKAISASVPKRHRARSVFKAKYSHHGPRPADDVISQSSIACRSSIIVRRIRQQLGRLPPSADFSTTASQPHTLPPPPLPAPSQGDRPFIPRASMARPVANAFKRNKTNVVSYTPRPATAPRDLPSNPNFQIGRKSPAVGH